MTFRAYADNVVIELEPPEKLSEVVTIVSSKHKHRTAIVKASGPGYTDAHGRFIPNEVKAGDRVIVDAFAGQDYAMDLTVPRHNKSSEFQELFGDRGEFRIVREQEILGIIEQERAAE